MLSYWTLFKKSRKLAVIFLIISLIKLIFIIWYFQNNITQMITAPTFRNPLLGLCINISIPSIDVSFDPVWFSSPSNRKLPCTIASFPLPTTSKNRRRRRFGAIPLFVPYRSNTPSVPYRRGKVVRVSEEWGEWLLSRTDKKNIDLLFLHPIVVYTLLYISKD